MAARAGNHETNTIGGSLTLPFYAGLPLAEDAAVTAVGDLSFGTKYAGLPLVLESFNEFSVSTPIVTWGAGADIAHDGAVLVQIAHTAPLLSYSLWAQGNAGGPRELVAARGAGVAGTGSVFAPWVDAGSDWTATTITAERAGGLGPRGATTMTFYLEVVDSMSQHSYSSHSYNIDPPRDALALDNVVPPDSSGIDFDDSIAFDVVTASGIALQHLAVIAHYPDAEDLYELVYDTAAGFSAKFGGSTIDTSNPAAWSLALERDDGWPAESTLLRIVAHDAELRQLSTALEYTVTDPSGIGGSADLSPPTVSDVSPPVGTPVTRSTPISLTVTDDVQLRRVVLIAKFSTTWEVVHDGTGFGPQYAALSSRTTLVEGASYRFRVVRTAGWPEAPLLLPIGTDTGGNEAP